MLEGTRSSSDDVDESQANRSRDGLEIVSDVSVQQSVAQVQVIEEEKDSVEFEEHGNQMTSNNQLIDHESFSNQLADHVTSGNQLTDHVISGNQLTDHVTSVLDGKQIEEATKAVTDLSMICRALRVLIVMQVSVMFHYIKQKAIKYTNNDQLRPIRVLVKKQFGVLSKHYSNHVKPRIKSNEKRLLGVGIVLATWTIFFVLYFQLFANPDYLERSFEGPSDLPPKYGPFYKRHVSARDKATLKEASMKKHRFNSFLSDQTPVNRDIPETRSEG